MARSSEIVAREKSPGGYHLSYRVVKDMDAPIPSELRRLEVQYAADGTWESAMQGRYKSRNEALLNFARRHSGFTETLKDVETDNPYVKKGIDKLFKEQADREAMRVEEERKNQADRERQYKLASELKEQFSKVHFKIQKTKIASEKRELPDEEGLSLGGLTITDNGARGKWKRYNVTHQQSGLLVTDDFKSLADAKIAIWRLTHIMNWDRSKNIVIKDIPKGLRLFTRQMRDDPYVEMPEELARVVAVRRFNPQGGETCEELGDIHGSEGYIKSDMARDNDLDLSADYSGRPAGSQRDSFVVHKGYSYTTKSGKTVHVKPRIERKSPLSLGRVKK